MHMRPLLAASVAAFSLLAITLASAPFAHAQINGTPASVTSPGFGGRAINGTPASVTSLGPRGFAPTPRATFTTVPGGMRYSRLQSNTNVVALHEILRDFQRQIHVSVVPCEALRRDSNNRVVLVNQLDRLPKHATIAVKVSLPELVTQHHNGLRFLPIDGIGRNQSASQRRRNSHKHETVRRHVGPVFVCFRLSLGCGRRGRVRCGLGKAGGH